jgi:hypothetical protein
MTLVALTLTGCSLSSRAIGKWAVVNPEPGAFSGWQFGGANQKAA